jgi:non-homologous end joining protein Ku
VEPPHGDVTPAAGADVIDLMAALQASIDARGGEKGEKRAPAKKAASRSAAKKSTAEKKTTAAKKAPAKKATRRRTAS